MMYPNFKTIATCNEPIKQILVNSAKSKMHNPNDFNYFVIIKQTDQEIVYIDLESCNKWHSEEEFDKLFLNCTYRIIRATV